MEQETMRIVKEDDQGVTFAVRHEWQIVQDDQLPDLNNYAIVSSFIGTNGIYHVLRDIDAARFLTTGKQPQYILLKYTVKDETGGIMISMVEISENEARDFTTHKHQLMWC